MITMSTQTLQKAVSKVEKGAGRNPLLPITGMIGVKVKSNILYLMSTDGTTDVNYKIDKIEADDVSITVKADTLTKLMSRVTSDSVSLTITDENLEIRANGVYKIPIEMDEEGAVDFPEIKFNKVGKKTLETNLTTIANILTVNKSALSLEFSQPALTGFYIGSSIVTGDGETATRNEIVFTKDLDKPMLLNPQLMYLLSLFEGEKIKYIRDNGKVYFYAQEMIVCGMEMQEVDDYPIEAITELLDTGFESSCKLPKPLILAAIERLQIFMETYDENGATFTFTDEGLTISSKRSSSVEKINYTSSENFKPFMCILHIPRFKELLKSNPTDSIKLCYGEDNAIKVESEKVVQILSLMEEAGE